jgi:hypothetical protein
MAYNSPTSKFKENPLEAFEKNKVLIPPILRVGLEMGSYKNNSSLQVYKHQ